MSRNQNRLFQLILLPLLISTLFLGCKESSTPRILVFSKTNGWKHSSIPQGMAAIYKLGSENDFLVDTTRDASFFDDDNLRQYHAVVFNNTTRNVLNAEQQAAFERYIQAGGGYVGIHAAADTEYEWPWYDRLVGAHFSSHPRNPNVRTAMVSVTDTYMPQPGATAQWTRTAMLMTSCYPGSTVSHTLTEFLRRRTNACHPIDGSELRWWAFYMAEANGFDFWKPFLSSISSEG